MSISPTRSPRSRSTSPKQVKNNLYVSNLSYKTQEQDLHDKFSKFGKIKYCQVIKDPYTHQSRGFGFVTFETAEDAIEAKSKLNSTSIDGREIRIELAKRNRAYSPTPGNYLGNPKFRKNYYKNDRDSYSKKDYDSPRRRYDSPRRRYDSPRRRYDSPKRRYDSPKRRDDSPKRSPKRKEGYNRRKFESPRRSPVRRRSPNRYSRSRS